MSEINNAGSSGPPPLPAFDPTNVQTYQASCHCGTVAYTVTLSPPLPEWKVVSCNCSICQRNGYTLVYPSREQLHISSGEDLLKSYSFGSRKNLHKFCGQCGSSVFFDPRMKEFGEGGGLDLLGINVSPDFFLSSELQVYGMQVRMFHDVDLEALDIVHVDNRSEGKESVKSGSSN